MGVHLCIHHICPRAQHYHTVALSGVPIFTSANIPQAYRFVTLIDVMYEHRCVHKCCCA